MKILFEATELSYFLEESGHRAGVFFVALNIFRELKKRGVELTFCCNFKQYYFLKNVLENVEEFDGIELLEEKNWLNKFWGKLNFIVRKSPQKLRYFILSLSRYYENIFYISSNKNSEQLADFNLYFSPFTPPSEEILRAKNLKRFIMLHDIIPILERGGIPRNKREWCYRIYNTITNENFYVTNSENTRKDILKHYPKINPENIKTTLLGADTCFAPQDKSCQEKYIFSLCTLGKRKNLIFAIRNFFEFIKRNNINDLKLVLAGGVWDKFKKELFKTIGEFDESKIKLLGYVKDEDLPTWYSNALMFIYPSLYEGFGLPVLEAMQCGCPVITSNTSSIPEVIGHAGIQIDPTNDEELKEAYEKMYYDDFFRKLCTERGLIRAKNFSWQKCVSELLEFIEAKSVEKVE